LLLYFGIILLYF